MIRVALLCLLCGINPLAAAELVGVQVNNTGSSYHLQLNARLQAPVREVERILTEIDNLIQVNRYLKESRVVQHYQNNSTWVHLVSESCIWFLCFELQHDQIFQAMHDGVLVAHIVPEHADFHSGSFRWVIKGDSQLTTIHMETVLEPAFRVPPIIGPYLMEKKLREMSLNTIRNLERIATGM